MLATPLKPEAPQPNHEILQLSFRGEVQRKQAIKDSFAVLVAQKGADSAGLSRPICIDLKLPEAW